ncbi:hypothetical protein RIE95_05900 [Acidithiobacillus thiooxidans]|uniref:hypothetical protein n=1 Tax=Acidithiobacillus thiooxidans TaxID=930 RepID=UPI002866FF88|nr:hypothetical protein [Acidithiobacillus thiooxidans]MDR7926525.1 hypothetical protein [Acidithiobacillus thiooxidans]
MTSKPFVLAHPADHYACGRYRVTDPLNALIQSGRVEGVSSDVFLDNETLLALRPEVVVFQRVLEHDQIAAIKRYRNALPHARLIMDIDDLIGEIPSTNRHRKGFHKDAADRFKKAAALCDRVVTSTEFLKNEYAKFAPESTVCQNRLPDDPWASVTVTHPKNNKPRVGWAGSAGHLGDLRIIIPAIRATWQEIDWVFLGPVPESIRKMAAEYHPSVSIDQYPAKLASLNLDLAVAPLEVSRYNHAKSALRILELGACGYPVLCSYGPDAFDIDLPVFRTPNVSGSWIYNLRLHTSGFLDNNGDDLRNAIHEKYLLSKGLDDWFNAWCCPPYDADTHLDSYTKSA